MKIQKLHIDARMYEMSGIGTYLQNMLPRMESLCESFDVYLHGTPQPLLSLAEKTGIPFHIIPLATEPYALRQTILPLGQTKNVENLWVPHYNIPLFGYDRLVVTIHDILHIRNDIVKRTLPQKIYANLLLNRVKNKAKHIAFDSHFSRNEFHKFVGEPIDETVIHIGVDVRWFDLKMHQITRPNSYKFLFYIGNQMKHKNLSTLLNAYLQLPESYPYHLVLAGKLDGLRSAEDHPLLSGKITHPKIHILGKVDQPALEAHMLHAEALVFPSLYEGFGLPPLEAMAAGTQVICSDIPVFRELYGDLPYWFDPRSVDHLKSTLLNIAQGNGNAMHQREKRTSHARNYSWEVAAKRQTEIIKNALN